MSKPSEDQQPVFPLCGWDIGPHKEQKAVLFRPHFIATPFDNPKDAQKGQIFAIPAKTALELAIKLAELCEQLEKDDTPIPEHLKN